MYTIEELFSTEHSLAGEYLKRLVYPWEAIGQIKKMIVELGNSLGDGYREVQPEVWVHETATIAPTAYLGAPCIIGPRTQVRHCAFIRGAALIGSDCVVGNSVEIKNAILFDRAQVPHFNYVGDSILGYRAHMGAGSITSNVKSDSTLVTIREGEQKIETGLKKLGALCGDYVEIGCNSVLNPGTVIGRNSTVYPLSCVRGIVPEASIVKSGGVIVKKRP